MGTFSLFSNTTGSGNTATGAHALYYNNGQGNTATGSGALYYNTSSGNTATGAGALGRTTDGGSNTATGYGALGINTTGDRNTAVGFFAGSSNTTGFLNTFIGYEAGFMSMGTGEVVLQLTNATAIGANAKVTANNALVLGDGTVNVGIGVTAPVNKLDVAGDIRIGTGSLNVNPFPSLVFFIVPVRISPCPL